VQREAVVRLDGEQTVLRVYLRSTDRCGWRSAAETLVERALFGGMAGAAVLRGFFGLDVTGRLQESCLWSLAGHVPVVVELVDTPDAVIDFLGVVETILPEGLVTLRHAWGSLYRHDPAAIAASGACLEPSESGVVSADFSPQGFPPVQDGEDGEVLRIFVGGEETWQGEPLYQAVVREAQSLGLAWAAVFRSPVGLGASGRLRRASLFGSMRELPVVVEVVDTAAGVRRLLPFLNAAVGDGLVAVEDLWVLRYRRDDGWSRL
jgi:uncharacterized protein